MKRCIALLFGLAACVRDEQPPPPRPPDAGHQADVRELYGRLLESRHELEADPDYRFGRPVLDRVAAWHWETRGEERMRAFGYRLGWRVDCWVKAYLTGFPELGESHHMAFFADGGLRAIFGEGSGVAPSELDKWASDWVDWTWRPSRASVLAR